MKTWTVTFHLKTKVPAATYEDVQAIVEDLEDEITDKLCLMVAEEVESSVDIEEDVPATGGAQDRAQRTGRALRALVWENWDDRYGPRNVYARKT